MTVYFITLSIVALFCAMAYKSDYAFPYGTMCDIRMHHTPIACFFFILASAALVFVAGFRYYVGEDFGAYYGVNPAWDEVWNKIVTLQEPGFYFLAYVSRRISNDPIASSFIAAAVTIVVALIVLYRNTDNLLIAGVFFTITSWDGCFNGVRQYLAASFAFAGYSALRDKKFAKYLMWVLIAFLFHRSAIVMIIPYFISRWDVNWRNILILAIGTTVVLYLYQNLFNVAGWILDNDATQVAHDAYAMHQVNIIRVFVALLPTVFFVVTNINRRRNEHINMCLNLLILNTCAGIVTMNSAFLYRITIYTGVFKLIAMPELLKLYDRDKRKILTWLMIILFGIMWWYENKDIGTFMFVWDR